MPYSNVAQTLTDTTLSHPVRIARRFNGPPSSGNGGWSAALLGKPIGREVEVTLKRPIPLEREIRVLQDSQTARLMDGDLEIASARTAELDLDIPDAITFAEAATARANFAGYTAHPFPNCFVCGTGRCCGEGMCLFTGPYMRGMVASSWVPDAEFLTPEGEVTPELVCAALDCPGAWALIDRYGMEGPMVLGRLRYRLDTPIHAGERYVVQGWACGREGRKAFCGTAVHDAQGEICAAAAATWIELR